MRNDIYSCQMRLLGGTPCVLCILTIHWAGHTICSFCRSDDLRWVVHGCIDRRALALVFSFVSIAHVDTFAMALTLHD